MDHTGVDIKQSHPGSERARTLADGIALYIHIPFCRTKCSYCDFNTYAGIGHLIPRYMESLEMEVGIWGEALGHPLVTTVFLGGGTPSLLSPEQLGGLLDTVRREFSLREDAEITTEVNPDDVAAERLAGFRSQGVNRLSMGVQSLNDPLLQLLGRRHSAEAAMRAYRRVREAGFTNVSLDLMYGLPHQGMEQWRDTLQAVVGMGPEHISAYCLTLEEGTPLERWVREGQQPEPDPDLAAEMYLHAESTLKSSGYEWYEISNWAQSGFESRHNLAYWHNIPYLGVGPGAHSYLGGYRFSIERDPAQYIDKVRCWSLDSASPALALDLVALQGIPQVEEVEAIDLALETAETAIMGLRLREGIDLKGFRQRFGRDLLEMYGEVVREVEGLGLLEVVGDGVGEQIRLTSRGRLLGNQVFWRFLDTARSQAL